ncbi:MAG: hypothetical protein KDD36_09600 [Flavobacteriales bacterium]|nr:hypothetical protein [Flavobacteriales bacterium]
MKLISNSKIHAIRLASFLVVGSGVITILANDKIQKKCLSSIRDVLNYPHLGSIIIAISLLLGIYYSYYYVRKGKQKELSLFKIFGPLIDPPVNSLGYGIVIASTLRFLKGIFNQKFFNEQYFSELDSIDIAAVLLACIPLLIWSIGGLINFFYMVFIRAGGNAVDIEPVSEDGIDQSA